MVPLSKPAVLSDETSMIRTGLRITSGHCLIRCFIYVERFSDFEMVTVRVFNHVLAGVPGSIGDFFDNPGSALLVFSEGLVNVLNPEKYIRV